MLPFSDNSGTIDWPGFRAHVTRTVAAGLIPAVNKDTGYVTLIDEVTRDRVLDETRSIVAAGGPFVAGGVRPRSAGDSLSRDAYVRPQPPAAIAYVAARL